MTETPKDSMDRSQSVHFQSAHFREGVRREGVRLGILAFFAKNAKYQARPHFR